MSYWVDVSECEVVKKESNRKVCFPDFSDALDRSETIFESDSLQEAYFVFCEQANKLTLKYSSNDKENASAVILMYSDEESEDVICYKSGGVVFT